MLRIQQELFCKNSPILLLEGFWPFPPAILFFFLTCQDCSRRRIAAHSLPVLSLCTRCDLRHDSLWAFLFSNRGKRRFLWLEKCLRLPRHHPWCWLYGCSELAWLHSDMNKLPSFLFKGVNNFVQYKFSHLPSKERQTIVELAKMFLNRINYWHLEAPSQRRLRSPNDDISGYKENYTR